MRSTLKTTAGPCGCEGRALVHPIEAVVPVLANAHPTDVRPRVDRSGSGLVRRPDDPALHPHIPAEKLSGNK